MLTVKQYNILINFCESKLNKVSEEYDHIISYSAHKLSEKMVEIYPEKKISYTHIATIVNDMVKVNNFKKSMIKIYQEVTFAMTIAMLTALHGFEISFAEFPSINLIYSNDRFCNIVENWNPQSKIKHFKNKSDVVRYAKKVCKNWKIVNDYNDKKIRSLNEYITLPLSNIGNIYLANSLGSDFIEKSTKRQLFSSEDYWDSQSSSYIKYLTEKNISLTPQNLIFNMLEYGWKRPRFAPVNLICDFIIRNKCAGRILDISNNFPSTLSAALITKCTELTHVSTINNFNDKDIKKVAELFPQFKISTTIKGDYDMGIMYYGKINKEYKNYNHWQRSKFSPDLKKVKNCRRLLIIAEDGYNTPPKYQIVHRIWNYFKENRRIISGLLIPKILRTKTGNQFKSFKNIITAMLIYYN